MKQYLSLNIEYNLNKNEFDITGDIKEEQRSNIIETVLRGQIGKDEDKNKPNEKDLYHINIKWYPQNDNFEINDDTGNKGLRDGILMQVLENLGNKEQI